MSSLISDMSSFVLTVRRAETIDNKVISYEIGELSKISVLVDPYMQMTDCRIILKTKRIDVGLLFIDTQNILS